jgi:membrane protease YdiL (CAAX protease family)
MQTLSLIGIQWMGVIAVTMIMALSPALKKRRALIFAYKQREGIISLSLFVLILAITAILMRYIQPLVDTLTPSAPFHYSANDLLQNVLFSLLLVVPCALALLVRRQPWLSAGLSRPLLRPGLELGGALALIAVFLTGKIYTLMYSMTADKWLFLVGAMVCGVCVEFVFRGYIQLRLCSWIGDTWGWLATSLLYVVWNLPLRLATLGTDPNGFAISMGVTLLLGLLLGWIMRKSGSALAVGIYHGVFSWLLAL